MASLAEAVSLADDSDDSDVEFELESFHIGSHHFEITTVSYMPLEKLMSLQSQSKEISGQKLWCGSLCIMEFLLGSPDYLSDSCVVELGSGTGLVGMLCNRLGAEEVILTDNDVRSLTHMKQDCERNGVQSCIVLPLDWFHPKGGVVEIFRVFDSIRGGKRKNLKIIAGDVLYKASLVLPFFEVVYALLSNSTDSKMLLCHVPRAGVDHENVITVAENRGLSLSPVEDSLWRKGIVLEYSPFEDYSRAGVYEIVLKHDQEGGSCDIGKVVVEKSDELLDQSCSMAHSSMINGVSINTLASELSSDTLETLMAHLKSESSSMSTSGEYREEIMDEVTDANLREPSEKKKWTDAKNHEYKEHWYWDERFLEEENFEWLLSFEQVKNHLLPYIHCNDRILIIGCGNSSFSNDLYDMGFKNIVNIDFSGNVIQRMRSSSQSAGRCSMQWIEMDMLDMTFESNYFDVVLDKATMDALMVDEGDVWNPKRECKAQAHELCKGISRVLKANGFFLQISFAQPHFRSKYLMGSYVDENCNEVTTGQLSEGVSVYTSILGWCSLYEWGLEYNAIEGGDGSMGNILYICHKNGKEEEKQDGEIEI